MYGFFFEVLNGHWFCFQQEPGPAKVAVTSSSILSAERVPSTKSTLWQEELKNKDLNVFSNPVRSPSQTHSPIGSSSMRKGERL